MTERERAALRGIRAQLARGEAEAALAALRALRETASPEFRARDLWRVHELFGAAFRLLGDAAGCAQAYYEAARADRFLRSQRAHYSSYLFALHYLPGISAAALAAQHFACGRLYEAREDEGAGARAVPPRPLSRGGGAAGTARPLRVGFLAPDFLDSAAARFYDVFFDLPRRAFTLHAYSLAAEEDELTASVRARTAAYRVFAGEGIAAADIVRADRLDVLVDLGGHTAGGVTLPLLARRLAPVQLEAVGWFDTTGVPAVDALLTDDVMDGAGAARLFTERLCRLPHAWCFTPTAAMRALAAQAREAQAARGTEDARGTQAGAAAGQAVAGGVTFAAFGNFLKISDAVLATWREILCRLPATRLVLQDTLRAPVRVRALQARLAAQGLPLARVAVRMGEDGYLAALARADVVLDTFPYPGGAMTATALALGVPVLTLAGSHHSARVGCSLLTAAGHPELIAADAAAYVRTACELARDSGRRARLRADLLRQQAEEAIAARRTDYLRHFAAALRQLAGGA